LLHYFFIRLNFHSKKRERKKEKMTTKRKKVLVITYYWPPAGGPGVQRVVRFVKYFRENGWEPIILTVKDGDYPAIDNSLLANLPDDLLIQQTPALEPYSIYRWLTGKSQNETIPTFVLNKENNENFKERCAKWIRANVFLPDARIGWLPFAVKAGSRLIRDEQIDLIFATSPPHTVQLIAKKLASRHRIPWVADFRDPWTEAFWAQETVKSRIAANIDASLEQSVMHKADLITTVSDGLITLFKQKGATRCEVIHSGFDLQNYTPKPSEDFTILFFGHLSKTQNPEPFFQALETLPQSVRQHILVVFIGRIFQDFEVLFNRYNAHFRIESRPYMPLKDVLTFARKASILLHPMIQASYVNAIIGAKMFDYLSLKKPILTLGEPGGIVEKVLQETNSGEIIPYHQHDKIREFILHYFRIWSDKKFVLLSNTEKLIPYTTKHNVLKLLTLFTYLTEQQTAFKS
jgi:glycosyltransferase involved in cell wall biosynthesis